jgi:hypothetical protein
MHFEHVGTYIVIVHDTGRPSDEVWNRWLDTYRQELTTLDGVLVYSLGGAPDADQRRQLQDVVEIAPRTPPTAIVSDSRLMRGLVTALNWFLPAHARGVIFAPAQFEKALDYLDVPVSSRAALRAVVARETARAKAS